MVSGYLLAVRGKAFALMTQTVLLQQQVTGTL